MKAPATSSPSATTHEPVSVARSISRSAPSSTAYRSTSDSTSRPSASVLLISTVMPLRDLSTSPSLYELPLTMFSTRPMYPLTFTGSLSRAMAMMAPSTVAAPAMSHFMVSMPVVGFDRQSAAVERHAFAHEGQPPAVARSPVVFENDEPRRPIARLSHGQHAAHPLLLQPLLIEHAARDAEILRELIAPLGKALGIQIAGRQVHQLSDDVDRFTQNVSALGGRFEVGGIRARRHGERNVLERRIAPART